MYLVKPNGNYNIVISDIGVAINSTNSALVEKSVLDNSGEAQKLLAAKLITVEDSNGNAATVEAKVEKTENVKIFVAREETTKVNEGVFVRQPEVEAEVPTQQVEEVKATEVVEVPAEEVITNTVETTPIVENTEVVTAETAEVKEETTQKSVTKKGKK